MPEDEKRAQAEERYVCGDATLKALAAEARVSYGTMRKWCKAGNWAKKRQSVRDKALKKAAEKAVNKKARELCRLLEASDQVESALLLAAKAIARNMDADQEVLMVTDGRERAGNLKSITQALGRQTETRMLLTGIMNQSEENGVKVVMDGETEEAAQ